MGANLLHDFRFALRRLSTSPAFTAAAILTIALGVGLNAGVFTVLNGLLFRDLPAPNAAQLISIEQTVEGGEFTATAGSGTFTVPEYEEYRDGVQGLSGLLAHSDPRETTLGGAAPAKVFGAIVSCNYFAVLETPPVLGRALSAQDCAAGADPVVVLGFATWSSAFGADPTILGRYVELQGSLFTVVGVAAEGTYGGSPLKTAYFAPLSAEPLLWPGTSRFDDPRYRWLHLIGRIAGDVSTAQARAELEVVAARIDGREPGRATALAVERAVWRTVPSFVRGAATGAAAVLMAAFGLVLVIACANVGNLLLARGAARSQEIGVRLSLGATRAHIVRQLLAESLLVSAAGGALGSVLALWSFQVLAALAVPTAVHPELPAFTLALDFSPDRRVVTFALLLTFGTGLLAGLAPALQSSRQDLNTVLKHDGGGGRGRRGSRLRGALVGVQVALCMALMIATGLLLRGLQTAHTVDPGFNYRDVMHLSFGTDGGPDLLDQAFLDEVAALPGVEAAAYALQTPLGESLVGAPIRLPGQAERDTRFAELDAVTPGYFSVLELPFVLGRNFTAADAANGAGGAPGPAIVTETTARNLWGETDVLGRSLLWDDRTLEVVGVVADARLGSLGAVDPYYVFVPSRGRGELLVRSRADHATTAAGIRDLVLARDPDLAFRVLPLEANVAWARGVAGLVSTIGSGLGALALVLAAVGIYGVISYFVTQRYREIGIRMALGAGKRDVIRGVLYGTLRPVAIGAAAGALAGGLASRVLSSALFGVSPADPLGIGGAVALVIVVGLGSALLAASPATRADPTTTLRYE